MLTENRVHEPVMVQEVLDLLAPEPGECHLDLTVGSGGHAAFLLKALGPAGRLIGADRDPAILDVARQVLEPYGTQVTLVQGISCDLHTFLGNLGLSQVDGVFLDLGVSSLQLDRPERGFSFRASGPLDMRMSAGRGQSAMDLIKESSAAELERIFREYGEEPFARRIALRLKELCRRRPPRTTSELAAFVASLVPPRLKGRRKIHPATRVFQALRMAVNDELGILERTLPQMASVLTPGGRMAVLSYHSLEDRLVKTFLREAERRRELERLVKRPLSPGTLEVARNPRSRSARLRGARRPLEEIGS